MAALTADRNTEFSLGDLLSIPVAASTTIYAGSLVCTNAAGYAVPAADTAGFTFEGVATEQIDNSSGANGDLSVVVRRRGRFRLPSASALNQASMSGEVCVSDDQTVADESDVTNDIVCGRIDRVISSSECWVSIDHYTSIGNAWNPVTTTTTTAA